MRSKEEEDQSHPRAAEVVGAEDDAVVFITVTGRHSTASVYMAMTLHCTTILSPLTPTVIPRC